MRRTTTPKFPPNYRYATLAYCGFAAVFTAIALAGAVGLSPGPAGAQVREPPAQQIIDALKPRTAPRGITLSPVEQRKAAAEDHLIKSLRSKGTRRLTLGERKKVAEIARRRPAIDIEVNFDYNKDTISAKAIRPLVELGVALRDPAFRGATILVAGHTDAKGSADYNLRLSERRADSVKRFLVEKFSLAAEDFVAVGYGEEQLKNTYHPGAAENRRVQIVNMSAK